LDRMFSRPTQGAAMEELAFGFAAAVYAVEPETNLLIASSEPFTISGFGDEAVG
jgi:hypothetical protein